MGPALQAFEAPYGWAPASFKPLLILLPAGSPHTAYSCLSAFAYAVPSATMPLPSPHIWRLAEVRWSWCVPRDLNDLDYLLHLSGLPQSRASKRGRSGIRVAFQKATLAAPVGMYQLTAEPEGKRQKQETSSEASEAAQATTGMSELGLGSELGAGQWRGERLWMEALQSLVAGWRALRVGSEIPSRWWDPT